MVSAYSQKFGAAGRVDWLNSYQGMLDLLGEAASGNGSQTYRTTNAATYVRVYNPRAFRCTHAYCFNGTVVTGNIDIGVYDTKGVKIASTGAIAQSGTSQIQWFALDALIPAGEVILALAGSNPSATLHIPSITSTHLPSGLFNALGWAHQSTAMPLPDPITPAELVAIPDNLPIFGVQKRWP